MNTYRRTAVVTGILFIVATAASLAGSSLTGPLVNAPDFLERVAASGSRMILGSLLTFVAAASSAGIAVALYPVVKRHGEGLAVGAVAFRLIESVFYIVGALCLLLLVPLSAELAGAQGQAIGRVLVAANELAGFIFAVLAFCIGGGLYYYAFYRSKLVPRWLSVWGLGSLVLLLSAVLITLFDGAPYSVSGKLVLLALPLALQEMVLAVWLIAKGFEAGAEGEIRHQT